MTMLTPRAAGATAADRSAWRLAYTPYWGWSNQLIELQTAASWARYTRRVLVLPTWAQSQVTGHPPALAEACRLYREGSGHPLCEPLAHLIDLGRLREFVPVELAPATEEADFDDDTLRVDFGIDFSTRANRMSHLVRWVDDAALLAYPEYNREDTPWCPRGVLKGAGRCLRSAVELQRSTARTIFFPRFTTFAVAKIHHPDKARRAELNDAILPYLWPSARVRALAHSVRRELRLGAEYAAIHVRRGDFLTVEWASDLREQFNARARQLREESATEVTVVYVATDDAPFVERARVVLKAAGFDRVVSWPNTAPGAGTAKPLVKAFAEQCVAIGAKAFNAQAGSTWSDYITRVRRDALLRAAHLEEGGGGQRSRAVTM